uniref:Uncharacterized protein n=1 Tax=Sphaerodactylus townsendi TaxID=933632 RepID=A0ACB8FCH9_9SAUR
MLSLPKQTLFLESSCTYHQKRIVRKPPVPQLCPEYDKELKQDISSFRFEVLGLLKGNKLPNLQSSKMGKDDDCLPAATEGEKAEGQEKGKRKNLSLFEITTMIHPRAVARASDRHFLSNGSALMASESTKEKHKKVNFVTDEKKFGFFHKQSKNVSAQQSTNQIYSISEEVSRQQMEEQLEEVEQVEEEELVVNCEVNINRPSEVAVQQQARTEALDSKPKEEATSSTNVKAGTGQDCELLTPKDLLDQEFDFSRDSAGKQGTLVQDNYFTTRL